MTMKPLRTLTRFQRGFMPFNLEHLDGALFTALCHHICVLAQAIYELGIEPILVWRPDLHKSWPMEAICDAATQGRRRGAHRGVAARNPRAPDTTGNAIRCNTGQGRERKTL